MQWVHIFNSTIPGPTTLIIGLVHGDEIVGKEAIHHLHQRLQSESFCWKIFTLYANLEGHKQDKRFLDHDLNRSFGLVPQEESYEITRAQEIQRYFDDISIDYMFDLHSTSSKSDPMILCTSQKASLDLASKMPIRYVIQWLIDIVEGTSLIKYFQKNITLGMAFECGCHKDAPTIKTGKKIIDTILAFHQRQELPDQKNQIKIKITDLIMSSDPNFTYTKPYQWFEELEKGEIWGRDNRGAYSFPIPKVLVMPNLVIAQELEKKEKVGVAYFGDYLPKK